MRNLTFTSMLLFSALLLLSISVPAEAQICVTSDASVAAYDDGWQDGDNDGSGFGPWVLTKTSGDVNRNGHFIGNSTFNGDGVDDNADGDINTAGRAWGLYANQGNVSRATRSFDSPLVSGSTFSVRIDNGIVDPGGGAQVGFELENSLGQNLVIMGFAPDINATEYILADGAGLRSTGVLVTDEGLEVEIEMVTATDYAMVITNLFDGVVTLEGGPLLSPGGGQSVDAVSIFNLLAGPDPPRDLFVNNLQACYPDTDNDDVADFEDLCPDTFIPEAAPTTGFKNNRWALFDSDLVFDTQMAPGGGPNRTYTTTTTGGCSCEQIVSELGLGNAHLRFGCSTSVMDQWVAYVSGGLAKTFDDAATTELPDGYDLSGVYPNPFNPQAQFTLQVAEMQHVTVRVYDVLGRQVITLHDGIVDAGQVRTFTVTADALPTGTYLIQAVGETFEATRQVVLLK